jgi:predicted dehydrogenase
MQVAIIGTGQVAERNYIPCLLKHPDVSLICYSRTYEKAEAVGRRFGVEIARTLEELFEKQPEAVFVLTREQQRLEAVRSLFPFRPERLFLEKPLTAKGGQGQVVPQDFWDAKALLLQAQDLGIQVAMVFNYRFFDQSQRARQVIQDRAFGKAVNVAALTHFACWSHCIDLILEFAGPLREITALPGTQPRHFESGVVPDLAASFLLGDQAAGTLLGTSGMQWDFPLFELIINFERGRFHFRDLDQEMELLDYNEKIHQIFSPRRDTSRWKSYDESFDKSVNAYLASIRLGMPPPVPGLAGLAELQFEASLKKSIAERRPVVASTEFPLDPIH